MTKAELIKAAKNIGVRSGDAEKLRAKMHADRAACEAALDEWCPPSRAAVPKKRKALPPLRAACGTLMDGDRLAEHVSRCAGCQGAVAKLQVSNDGVNWTNYTGDINGVHRFPPRRTGIPLTASQARAQNTAAQNAAAATSEPGRAHAFSVNCSCSGCHTEFARLYPATAAREAAKTETGCCDQNDAGYACSCLPTKLHTGGYCRSCKQWAVVNLVGGTCCQACGAQVAIRIENEHAAPPAQEAAKRIIPPLTFSADGRIFGPYPSAEACEAAHVAWRKWMDAQTGKPCKRPAGLIDRRLVHSYGIEDPALPNA